MSLGAKEAHRFPPAALTLSASAELAVLCYSTWYPATTWRLFAHVPVVSWPDIWYVGTGDGACIMP